MMKLANLQNDISESIGTAETDVYPAEDAFPFGAYRMNGIDCLVVRYGKAPLSAYKVLAFSAEKRVVPRGALRLVLMNRTGLFIFSL